jgi:hypothetical protein
VKTRPFLRASVLTLEHDLPQPDIGDDCREEMLQRLSLRIHPEAKPKNVDQEVQRTGVAARCCTTVRRVTRNSGNAECLKIVDNTRALVRPDAPLGVARYVAAEFHRKQDDHSVCVWELPGSAAHRECLQCDAPDCILLV